MVVVDGAAPRKNPRPLAQLVPSAPKKAQSKARVSLADQQLLCYSVRYRFLVGTMNCEATHVLDAY